MDCRPKRKSLEHNKFWENKTWNIYRNNGELKKFNKRVDSTFFHFIIKVQRKIIVVYDEILSSLKCSF